MASRQLSDLHPKLRGIFVLAADLFKARHPTWHQPALSCTARSGAEQDALYAQPHDGRDNDGDGRVDEADECVTHARAGQSAHNVRTLAEGGPGACAFDVAFPIPGTKQCDWDAVNFEMFARCVQDVAAQLKVRVTSGIGWPATRRDPPHHELTGWEKLT